MGFKESIGGESKFSCVRREAAASVNIAGEEKKEWEPELEGRS